MRSWLILLLVLFAMVDAFAYDSVFLEGDMVVLPIPDIVDVESGKWRVLNDEHDSVAAGKWLKSDGSITLGALPTGWYRVVFSTALDEDVSFTTTAVLARQPVAPPEDTPVALDVAMSWVPENDPTIWEHCARLARMAGVRMVRDRLRWRDMQPERDEPLLRDTVYDRTADLQREHGLHLVQVFHDSPSWTWERNSDRGRVPADLRDTWRFCRDASLYFGERVQAWQPWNEGNAGNFGGHAIDALCSHQKAAYLGFRAGNPDAIVTWAPLGGINSAALSRGISANGVSSYFDVYAMHSYDWCHDYPRLRQHALDAAAGKPLWVMESDRGMRADPDSPYGDLTHENERRKAEFIVQSYASSLAAGATRHFHFILPHYMEQQGTVQFGLLRHDYTPRMGFVALAATGRFLAGARYLGRVGGGVRPDVYVFAFRAFPDGSARDVLVAWTEARVDWPERGRAAAEAALPPELPVAAVYDYLGRSLGNALPERLTSAPLFIVLAEGAADSLALEKPAPVNVDAQEKPSPVVLQLRAPDAPIVGRVVDWAHEHDRVMSPGNHDVAIVVYNFGEDTATGVVTATELPPGWQCEPDAWTISLEPMERLVQPLRLYIPEPGASAEEGAWLYLAGDFGALGQSQLAFRIMPETE